MRRPAAAAAVALGVLLGAAPAMAQCSPNAWCRGGTYTSPSKGTHFIKILSRNGSYVTAMVKTRSNIWKQVYDCSGWRHRTLELDGVSFSQGWEDILPGTVGETNLRVACGR